MVNYSYFVEEDKKALIFLQLVLNQNDKFLKRGIVQYHINSKKIYVAL